MKSCLDKVANNVKINFESPLEDGSLQFPSFNLCTLTGQKYKSNIN